MGRHRREIVERRDEDEGLARTSTDAARDVGRAVHRDVRKTDAPHLGRHRFGTLPLLARGRHDAADGTIDEKSVSKLHERPPSIAYRSFRRRTSKKKNINNRFF